LNLATFSAVQIGGGGNWTYSVLQAEARAGLSKDIIGIAARVSSFALTYRIYSGGNGSLVRATVTGPELTGSAGLQGNSLGWRLDAGLGRLRLDGEGCLGPFCIGLRGDIGAQLSLGASVGGTTGVTLGPASIYGTVHLRLDWRPAWAHDDLEQYKELPGWLPMFSGPTGDPLEDTVFP
jgi:hypothetical protein